MFFFLYFEDTSLLIKMINKKKGTKKNKTYMTEKRKVSIPITNYLPGIIPYF